MKRKLTAILSLIMAFAIMAVPLCMCGFKSAAAEKNPKDEGALFTVQLLSDTHIGINNTSTIMTKALKRIQSENYTDAVVVAGDLCNSGSEKNINTFYKIVNSTIPDIPLVTAAGNHDFSQLKSSTDIRKRYIKYNNLYLEANSDKIYYSKVINGYKFIVLGDEGESVNGAVISSAQIEFLKKELASNEENRPVFVICHWPLSFTNGEYFLWPIWPGGGVYMNKSMQIRSILKKYNNVFFISGHLHAGLNGTITKTIFNACCVEEHDGIKCINVPALGKTNRFGVKTTGTGMELNIYKDKVVIKGRNFVNGNRYDKYTYEYKLSAFDTQGNSKTCIEVDEPIITDEIQAETDVIPEETEEEIITEEVTEITPAEPEIITENEAA